MTTHYDAGALRASLDGELPEAERAALADHLADCADCRARLAELRALAEDVSRPFPADTDATPDEAAAFARLRPRLDEASVHAGPSRASLLAPSRRPALAGLTVAAALLIVILTPGVRAAASQLLQVFRAQQVVYVSVPPSRIQQLQNLHVDANTLFLSKPAEVGTPVAPITVDSLAAAGAQLGFAPKVPTNFPSAPDTTTYTVMGRSAYQLRVNVATLRQLLATLGVTDVTIPDALGAQPINITLPAGVEQQYTGKDYSLTLIQGTSPTVSLPPGVDLAQLGKAALEVYGMSPQQADTLSKRIDWGSTLVFPFPLGASRIQQVSVDGAQGVLLNAGGEDHNNYLLYWQKGSHYYILNGQGGAIGDTEFLVIANSVK